MTIPGGKMALTKIDKAALELAMEIARKDASTRKQLDAKLKDESWQAVAEFAAYGCQIRSLKLRPWQDPPCFGDPDGLKTEDQLARRLIDAGVSVWHPSPLEALQEAPA